MGVARPKKPQPLASWILTSCRLLTVLSLVLLTYLLTSTIFVPLASNSNDDVIDTLVVERITNDGSKHLNDRSGATTFFLAAVIFNRVFPQDLFNISAYECKQWIEYMLHSGVEHIFWYDTAHSDSESQEPHLSAYVHNGVLTYHRFHHLFPGHVDSGYHFEQDKSYEHFLSSYSAGVQWVVEMDVDEYPFMASKLEESFLKEFVEEMEREKPHVSQVLMQCMIFGGNPQGDLENGWVIERYQRRKRETEGVRPGFASRTKPIFRVKDARGVMSFDPHEFPMKKGETVVAEPEVLRMNHYWGARLSDFKADSPEVVAMLVPDSSIQPIAEMLKKRTGLTSRAVALTI